MTDSVLKEDIEKAVNEAEALLKEEIMTANTAVSSSRSSAPQSYLDDMKGFSRGLSVARSTVFGHLRERLLR